MKTIQFSNLDLDTQKKIVLEHKIRPIMDGYEEIDYEPLLESLLKMVSFSEVALMKFLLKKEKFFAKK
jgi:hypothetical protein